jgi:hypothetical protein
VGGGADQRGRHVGGWEREEGELGRYWTDGTEGDVGSVGRVGPLGPKGRSERGLGFEAFYFFRKRTFSNLLKFKLF